jgi:hypothetical protein
MNNNHKKRYKRNSNGVRKVEYCRRKSAGMSKEHRK